MSISNFAIRLDDSSLSCSDSGQVSGVITINVDGFEFPDSQWNDFIVIILTWWASEVTNLILGGASEVRCNFMDGPYFMNIKATDEDGILNVDFIKEGESSFVNSSKIEQYNLVSSLKVAINTVIRHCIKMKWSNDDVAGLEHAFSKLQSATKVH